MRHWLSSILMARILATVVVLVTPISGLAQSQDASRKDSNRSRTGVADSPPQKRSSNRAPSVKKTPKDAAGSEAPPQVLSKAAADARRPRSPFLQHPNDPPADRYGEETDWNELPAWRKASFFGIRARGQFFVFVVDHSGSMIDEDRLTQAKIELRRSIFALHPPQRFEVIFYNDEATPMPGGPLPRSADQKSKDQLTLWLRLIDPDGETDPKSALGQAIALRPDAVFLLSDGEFPDGTAEKIGRLNARKVPIHCVDLSGGKAGDHLQRIARESGGRYISRPGSLQASP